jgi:hypothetical protein
LSFLIELNSFSFLFIHLIWFYLTFYYLIKLINLILYHLTIAILESESRPGNFSSQLSETEKEKETSRTNPLHAYSTAIAIARMACADCTDSTVTSTYSTSVAVLTPSFVRTAILDLLVLCSSRVKLGYGSGKHTVEPPVKRRDLMVKGMGTGGREGSGIEGLKVRIPSVDFSSLLSRLLRFISRKRGYENSSLLLVDHCRWLLCEWIKISCGSHANEYNNGNNYNEGNSENKDENESDQNNNNNNNLKLEDFPYQILDPYCSSFKQFLTNFGDIIFPLICMIENSKKRWTLLLGEKTFNFF